MRVTVHVLAAPGPIVVGLQARDDTATATVRLTEVVCEPPFKAAVMVTV